MRMNPMLAMSIAAAALSLATCNNDPRDVDTITVLQSYGPTPALPAPQQSRVPTVNVARAVGWPSGGKPKAADGMALTAFATGLDHPRTVYVLPTGDVLVAESDAPAKPAGSLGIRGWIAKQIRKWA